jgi:Negative regulator of sigma F
VKDKDIDQEIDQVLEGAARAPHRVERAVLEGVTAAIQGSLRPVRPLPPKWVLASGLVVICAAIATAGAARAGFYGFEKMNTLDRALIFSTLGLLIWAAGAAFVSEMIPGSRRFASPGALLRISIAALLGVFVVLFRDYHTEHFISVGLTCLFTGFAFAVPTGLLSWLVLRRGFAVNRIAAGLAAGILGGLAGVTLLELHCLNFEAPHILLWHTAVVPLSAAAGAFLGWAMRFLQKKSDASH